VTRERFEKRTLYEFCETRKLMVRLLAIQSTVIMPDMVQAEIKLLPVDCNLAAECRRNGIRCLVYDPLGIDPCPGLWKGLD
jgi:diketogulonate reductase-like aldo/keto reductase